MIKSQHDNSALQVAALIGFLNWIESVQSYFCWGKKKWDKM